jgi:hypothetical protein
MYQVTAGSLVAFLLAVSIGAGLGLSELLSRYKWALGSILWSRAGWAYLAINGGVAALAYKAALDWGVGTALAGKPELWRVLLVSIGAMFFLRSSLAQVRFGNHEVGIGLVTILEVFSRRAERRLDQVVTRQHWESVGQACSLLTYKATKSHLVAVSEVALASQDEREREAFRAMAAKIDDMPVDDETRMRLLAMVLGNMLGRDLFDTIAKEAAVRLKTDIEADRGSRTQRANQLVELKASLTKHSSGA